MKKFCSDFDGPDFIIEDDMSQIIWQEFIEPLMNLESCYIEINQDWRSKENDISPGKKASIFREMLENWNNIYKRIPQIKEDIEFLSVNDEVIDTKIQLELCKLEKKLRM